MIFASSYLSYKAIIGTLGTMHNVIVHQGGRKQILDGKATVDRKNLITYTKNRAVLNFLLYKIPKTWVGKCLPCLPSSAPLMYIHIGAAK